MIRKIEVTEVFNAEVCKTNSTTVKLSIPKKSIVDVYGVKTGQILKLQLLAIMEKTKEEAQC